MLDGLSPATLALALAVVFASGLLRGFSGFGFALAAVPLLSLLLEPAEVVPAVLLLQVLDGLHVLPRILKLADWRGLTWLVAGALAGAPAGVWALTALPADAMRAAAGLAVLAAVLVLWRGWQFRRPPKPPLRLGIGLVSGLLGGAAAMSGPPVVIFFLASPLSAAVGRASLLGFFLLTSAGNATLAWGAGLVSWGTLLLALMLFPALFLGSRLGARRFDRATPALYRGIVLAILLMVALLALGRAALGLAGGG